MTPTTEELAAELDELAPHMALGPNQSATLRAAAARLRELEAALKAARGWVVTCSESAVARRDLKRIDDILRAQLTKPRREP